MGRGGLYAIAAALCFAAAAGIVALVVADGFLLESNLVYTALGLLVFGAVAVVGASMTGAFAWVGWLAAVAAVAAFVFLMVGSWQADEFGEGSETDFRIGAVIAVLGTLATALIPLVRRLRRPA